MVGWGFLWAKGFGNGFCGFCVVFWMPDALFLGFLGVLCNGVVKASVERVESFMYRPESAGGCPFVSPGGKLELSTLAEQNTY